MSLKVSKVVGVDELLEDFAVVEGVLRCGATRKGKRCRHILGGVGVRKSQDRDKISMVWTYLHALNVRYGDVVTDPHLGPVICWSTMGRFDPDGGPFTGTVCLKCRSKMLLPVDVIEVVHAEWGRRRQRIDVVLQPGDIPGTSLHG